MATTLKTMPTQRNAGKYSAGFTLLEVLIALAIFALLSAAIVGQTSSSFQTQTSLETKRIAKQLLDNTVEQYQLMDTLAGAGREMKMVKFADRNWNVEVLVENTRRADMRLIKASVYEANSRIRRFSGANSRNSVAKITAYVGAH